MLAQHWKCWINCVNWKLTLFPAHKALKVGSYFKLHDSCSGRFLVSPVLQLSGEPREINSAWLITQLLQIPVAWLFGWLFIFFCILFFFLGGVSVSFGFAVQNDRCNQGKIKNFKQTPHVKIFSKSKKTVKKPLFNCHWITVSIFKCTT